MNGKTSIDEIICNPNQAIKHDQGKVDLTYVSYELMYAVSRVREFGARKYSRDNFKGGAGKEWVLRNFAAVLRHIFSRLRGEILDPESKLPHTWHALCGLEHIVYAERNEKESEIK